MATTHSNITVNLAPTVHAAYQLADGTVYKRCGSWANTGGSRAPRIYKTDAVVTCKSCLKAGA